MQRIIDGRRYNTDTAELLCDISRGGLSCTDFAWDDTNLYVTKRGAFFISGRGGPRSRWAVAYGQNGWSGSSGLRPISSDDARRLLEQHGDAEQVAEYFTVTDA